MEKICLSIFLMSCLAVTMIEGQGYLLTPPARGTAWRMGYNTPKDTNDMGNFCGGRENQHNQNGGKCGVCGEDYSNKMKLLEPGTANKYATGTIVGDYTQGDTIDVTIVLTAFQEGYYEYRLCENNVPQTGKDASIAVTHDCLNKNLLKSAVDDTTQFLATPGTSVHKVQLPVHITCTACVFQWRYRTGNNWGCENDNKCGLGLGPQEEFVGCSDIAIRSSDGPQVTVKTTPELKVPTKPAVTPDVTTPNVTTPNVTTPDVTTPNVTTPNVTTPKVTTPKVTIPSVTTPNVTTPNVTTPKVITPNVTTPDVTTPDVTTPDVTTPKVTIPSVTTPKVTIPSVTTPDVTTPDVTTPDVTTPDVTTPDVTIPSVTTPKVMTPAVTSPKPIVKLSATSKKIISTVFPKVSTTTTQKPKPTPKPTGGKGCRGIAPYAGPSMDYFCRINCNHVPPHCPPTHCKC